jgi:hypothetical protein
MLSVSKLRFKRFLAEQVCMGTDQVSTKLYEDDLEKVRNYQEQHGVNQSEAVRRLVRSGADTDRPGLKQYSIILVSGVILTVPGFLGIVPYIFAQLWAFSVLCWFLFLAVQRR